MESKAIPNFPAIFRVTKHQGDRALISSIKDLAGPLAGSFFKSMQIAIENSAWAQTSILVPGSVFDGMPHVFRILPDHEVCGTVTGEDGQKEEIKCALPLPIELMHWMRREVEMVPIIPCTPPEYCDAFTLKLMFCCRSFGIKDADIQFCQKLAKSIVFPGQGIYAGPSLIILEHLEMLGLYPALFARNHPLAMLRGYPGLVRAGDE